ncbi:MAG: hypothetical protein QXJ53_00915 [Candidatus Bathyarchaeia archaeon]
MKLDESKAVANALTELSESYADFLQSLNGTLKTVKATKKLWNNGSKPWLIKLGVALLVFPEPFVSDILGSLLIATGTVQEGIRRRTLHVEDIPTTFKTIMKELQTLDEQITGRFI